MRSAVERELELVEWGPTQSGVCKVLFVLIFVNLTFIHRLDVQYTRAMSVWCRISLFLIFRFSGA